MTTCLSTPKAGPCQEPAFGVGWSEIDGLRTAVPHVPYVHGPVSVTAAKEAARSRRDPTATSPSRRAVREAVLRLTAAGDAAAFAPAQVRDALAELGHAWSALTVRELLEDEAASPAGLLVCARRGLYRLRGARELPSATSRAVTAHVQAALEELTAQGRARVTRRELEEALRAAGTTYSGRAVRDGLLRLRRADPPVVRATGDGRYMLLNRDGTRPVV